VKKKKEARADYGVESVVEKTTRNSRPTDLSMGFGVVDVSNINVKRGKRSQAGGEGVHSNSLFAGKKKTSSIEEETSVTRNLSRRKYD
jgi:hypothetical protein